ARGGRKRLPTDKINGIRGPGVYPMSNKRDVWTVATQSFRGPPCAAEEADYVDGKGVPRKSHYATFPEQLVEPMILAATSQAGCCHECGTAWRRVVERTPMVIKRSQRGEKIFGNNHSTAASGTMVSPALAKT